jgi:hypothetical protein
LSEEEDISGTFNFSSADNFTERSMGYRSSSKGDVFVVLGMNLGPCTCWAVLYH